MYQFTMKHIPGKTHSGPDATSRYPGRSTTTSSIFMNSHTQKKDKIDIPKTEVLNIFHTELQSKYSIEQAISACAARSCAANGEFRVITWDTAKVTAACDDTSVAVNHYIEMGFPADRSKMPDELKTFWHLQNELYTVDGVPMYTGRIYIPQSLRREVLEALHSAHQGEASMKAAARSRFFWPGMDAAIKQLRAQCKACNGMAPSQPREEMPEPPSPDFPFQDIAIDYYHLVGHNYAIYVDRYSGWLGIFKPNTTKFGDLTTYMRQNFQTFGVPEVVETDGGPPFNGKEWRDFLQKWGIRHRLSSGNYHQSNSRAELAVKTAKRLLRDNLGHNGTLDTDEVSRALLQYLNTPIRGLQESPAQIIYGHPVRDTMPQGPGHEMWRHLNTHRELGQARLKAELKERYDEHTKTSSH